jgi:hypothetical protein
MHPACLAEGRVVRVTWLPVIGRRRAPRQAGEERADAAPQPRRQGYRRRARDRLVRLHVHRPVVVEEHDQVIRVDRRHQDGGFVETLAVQVAPQVVQAVVLPHVLPGGLVVDDRLVDRQHVDVVADLLRRGDGGNRESEEEKEPKGSARHGAS